jgi:tetratricopeptide (TPR) repeat protein
MPTPASPPQQRPRRNALDSFDLALVPYYRSRANKSQQWYPEAAELFSDAIAAAPEFAEAFEMRARCYKALGELDKAAADTAAARRLLESRRDRRQPDKAKAEALCRRVREQMERGGLIADSLLLLHKAIDADPECADAYDIRADIYFNLQMPDESMADIRRSGELKRVQPKSFWKRLFS